MKIKRTILTLGAAAFAFAGSSFARTWTSSDGKNTFEGDFVSATDTKVTVNKSNKKITFDIVKLSSDDQTWIKEEVERLAAVAKAKEESEKLASAAIPKAIKSKLVKLDGKRLKKAKLPEIIPKYYFLAYSASW